MNDFKDRVNTKQILIKCTLNYTVCDFILILNLNLNKLHFFWHFESLHHWSATLIFTHHCQSQSSLVSKGLSRRSQQEQQWAAKPQPQRDDDKLTSLMWRCSSTALIYCKICMEHGKCLIPKTHLSRKPGRSGSGAGAGLWELSISEGRPRPSLKARGSNNDLE